MIDVVWLIVAGLVSGIIGGMGMGGGTLLIPILTIFLGFSQKSAQAINLLVFIPMAIFSLIIHIKNKLVDFNVGIPIMLIGIIFSILGSTLANLLTNENLKIFFGIFLLIVGVYQGIQTITSIKKSNKQDREPKIKFRIYFK